MQQHGDCPWRDVQCMHVTTCRGAPSSLGAGGCSVYVVRHGMYEPMVNDALYLFVCCTDV